MSASKQGSKAARMAERKRLRNRFVRRTVKTGIVRVKSAIEAGEEAAKQKTMLAISSLDKAVSKGVVHRNKAARLKSRLTKRLNKKQLAGKE